MNHSLRIAAENRAYALDGVRNAEMTKDPLNIAYWYDRFEQRDMILRDVVREVFPR